MNTSWRRELLNYSQKPTILECVWATAHISQGKMSSMMPQSKHILAEIDLNFSFCWQGKFATGMIFGAKLSRFMAKHRNVGLGSLRRIWNLSQLPTYGSMQYQRLQGNA